MIAPANYERVGITASRDGLTDPQLQRLESALTMLVDYRQSKFFHHGDCVGGDRQGALAARVLGYTIIAHPPIVPTLRAYFPSDWEFQPAEYKERDRALVDAVDLLIGCPNSFEPRPRSGTWYTIGYAEGTGTNVSVILPDGSWRR